MRLPKSKIRSKYFYCSMLFHFVILYWNLSFWRNKKFGKRLTFHKIAFVSWQLRKIDFLIIDFARLIFNQNQLLRNQFFEKIRIALFIYSHPHDLLFSKYSWSAYATSNTLPYDLHLSIQRIIMRDYELQVSHSLSQLWISINVIDRNMSSWLWN